MQVVRRLDAIKVLSRLILGTVELSGDEDSQQYCFQLVFHGENNRTYYMGASSQTEMESWMKALTCVRLTAVTTCNGVEISICFRQVTITWSWWCRNCKGSSKKSTVEIKDTHRKVTHPRQKLHRDNDKIHSTNPQAVTTPSRHHQVCPAPSHLDAFCFLRYFINRFFVGWRFKDILLWMTLGHETSTLSSNFIIISLISLIQTPWLLLNWSPSVTVKWPLRHCTRRLANQFKRISIGPSPPSQSFNIEIQLIN